MQYYIYENDKCKLVSEEEYDQWHRPFDLPTYSRVINDSTYSIDTMFKGPHDVDELDNPLPFIVFYFEDKPELADDGIFISHDNDTIDYFDNYQDFITRFNSLVEQIDAIATPT